MPSNTDNFTDFTKSLFKKSHVIHDNKSLVLKKLGSRQYEATINLKKPVTKTNILNLRKIFKNNSMEVLSGHVNSTIHNGKLVNNHSLTFVFKIKKAYKKPSIRKPNF